MTTERFRKEWERYHSMSIQEQKNYFSKLYGIACEKLSDHMRKLFVEYKLQELCYGGLTLTDMNRMKCIAQNKEVSQMIQKGRIFKRIYNGRTYVVERLSNGAFLYDGETYESLSSIASTITGRNTNGNTFFATKRYALVEE